MVGKSFTRENSNNNTNRKTLFWEYDMQQTGYREAMEREFKGREVQTVKRVNLTSEENNRSLVARRKIEAIKEARSLREELELN